MRLNTILLLLCLSLNLQAQNTQKEQVQYPKLLKNLLERKKTDQLYRNLMTANTPKKTLDSLVVLQNKMDKTNRNWLKKQVKKHGWLGFKEVGNEGDNIAWLIIQHSDNDTAFQIKMLQVLKKQTEKNNTNKMNFAYLTDRTLVNQGKKQIYSTQVKDIVKDSTGYITNIIFQPIENESKIDSLRATVSMPPQAVYKAGFIKRQNDKMKK